MLEKYSWLADLSVDYSQEGHFYMSGKVWEEHRGEHLWKLVHVVTEHATLRSLSVAGTQCL
jgi:hypothetical protein